MRSINTEDEATALPVSFSAKLYGFFTQNHGLQIAYSVVATVLGSATIVSVPLFGLYSGIFNPTPIVSKPDPIEVPNK